MTENIILDYGCICMCGLWHCMEVWDMVVYVYKVYDIYIIYVHNV